MKKLNFILWALFLIPLNALMTSGAFSSMVLMVSGDMYRADMGEAGKSMALASLVFLFFPLLLVLYEMFVSIRLRNIENPILFGLKFNGTIVHIGCILSFCFSLIAAGFIFQGLFRFAIGESLSNGQLLFILLFNVIPMISLLVQARILWRSKK